MMVDIIELLPYLCSLKLYTVGVMGRNFINLTVENQKQQR